MGEMQYVCDAPMGKTWFRIETEGEAAHESRLMRHTVEKYFCREREKAVQSWRPERPNAIERDIGLEAMYSERCRFSSRCATGRVKHWLQRCCHRVARIAAGSGSSSLPHPMPILILSRMRPSLR